MSGGPRYRVVQEKTKKKVLKPGACRPYMDFDYIHKNSAVFFVERRAWWGEWRRIALFESQAEAEKHCEDHAKGLITPGGGLIVSEYEYKQ